MFDYRNDEVLEVLEGKIARTEILIKAYTDIKVLTGYVDNDLAVEIIDSVKEIERIANQYSYLDGIGTIKNIEVQRLVDLFVE